MPSDSDRAQIPELPMKGSCYPGLCRCATQAPGHAEILDHCNLSKGAPNPSSRCTLVLCSPIVIDRLTTGEGRLRSLRIIAVDHRFASSRVATILFRSARAGCCKSARPSRSPHARQARRLTPGSPALLADSIAAHRAIAGGNYGASAFVPQEIGQPRDIGRDPARRKSREQSPTMEPFAFR